jgi:integrase/recombinase XerD
VPEAVAGRVTRWPPASVRRCGCSLRSFLRCCYLVGLVDRDLPAAALPVPGRRRSLLPEGITAARARALLRACDRRRAGGRGDYAVIVVLLRPGLRAREVATLRLEDLDWRAGQVTVHGRGHRVDQLPVPAGAGEAIAACRCRGRPRTATVREVSVRVRPPRAGRSRGAVTAIVARAAGRARPGAVRAHRLRRTAASDMLRAGAPLGEIGPVLRQRPPGSAAACARAGVGRLRAMARPWPAGAAS